MDWKQATWGRKSVTLAIPYSRQEQLQKLKMPSFIYIKADEKNRAQDLKKQNSLHL